jgi:hypothetical protein
VSIAIACQPFTNMATISVLLSLLWVGYAFFFKILAVVKFKCEMCVMLFRSIKSFSSGFQYDVAGPSVYLLLDSDTDMKSPIDRGKGKLVPMLNYRAVTTYPGHNTEPDRFLS